MLIVEVRRFEDWLKLIRIHWFHIRDGLALLDDGWAHWVLAVDVRLVLVDREEAAPVQVLVLFKKLLLVDMQVLITIVGTALSVEQPGVLLVRLCVILTRRCTCLGIGCSADLSYEVGPHVRDSPWKHALQLLHSVLKFKL